MLFYLICVILPTWAHLTNVGKIGNKMNSPETYANFGQFQMNENNEMKPMHSGFAPLMEACKMGKCSTRMVNVPLTKEFNMGCYKSGMILKSMPEVCIMRKCSGRMIAMVNNHSTMPNHVMSYGNMQKEATPMWMGDRILMPQMIASPSLNFKVKQIGNVSQKGDF